jgi:hypothetical protein
MYTAYNSLRDEVWVWHIVVAVECSISKRGSWGGGYGRAMYTVKDFSTFMRQLLHIADFFLPEIRNI